MTCIQTNMQLLWLMLLCVINSHCVYCIYLDTHYHAITWHCPHFLICCFGLITFFAIFIYFCEQIALLWNIDLLSLHLLNYSLNILGHRSFHSFLFCFSCYTETEVAPHTFYIILSELCEYTDLCWRLLVLFTTWGILHYR